MAGDDPISSVYTRGDGPNDPQPVVNLAGSDDPLTSIHNQSQPEPDLSDPVMHFVVQNFNQINAMYVALQPETIKQSILHAANKLHTINWRGAPSQGNSATPRRHVKNPSSKLL
ncbi:hypothetical protein Tco_0869620 [Tanacetum coccineum]